MGRMSVLRADCHSKSAYRDLVCVIILLAMEIRFFMHGSDRLQFY